MSNRLFCGCCGCLILDVANWFAFEETTSVSTWTVSEKTLPVGGHYSITSAFTFRGLVPTEYRIELGLMKADNTLFATWYYDGTLDYQDVPDDYGDPGVLRGPTHLHDGDWSMTWPGESLTRNTLSGVTFVVDPDDSLTDGHMDDSDDPFVGSRTLFADQIAVRPSAALFFRNTGIAFATNCTLPLTDTQLADAGPLRIAARMIKGWDGETGTNADTPADVIVSTTLDYNDTPRAWPTESTTISRTLTIDDTPIVYDPVDAPRIFVDVLFDEIGVINVPDSSSFGLIYGRVENITPRTGARFRVDGIATTGTIQEDGSFVLAISFAMRSSFPQNGLIDIEVEEVHDSAEYVGLEYHIYKRPNHFAIAFPEDRNANNTLKADEVAIEVDLIKVRIDIPNATFVDDELSITVSAVTETIVLDSEDIAAKYVIRNYPRPADAGTLAVSATLKRALPKVLINPVNVIDRIEAAGPGIELSGSMENVLTTQAITAKIGATTLAGASFIGSTSNWSVSVPAGVRNVQAGEVTFTVSITDVDGNVSIGTRVVSFDPTVFQVVPISDYNRDGEVYSDELTDGELRYRIDVPDTFRIGDTITVVTSSGGIREKIIDEDLIDDGYFVVGFPAATAGDDFVVTATSKFGGWGLSVVAERILVEGVPDGYSEYDGYGYSYDGEVCVGQTERNTTCINPVRCPVTFPNYGTPRFTESSISGIPFSTTAIPSNVIATDDNGCSSGWSRPLQPPYPDSGLTFDDYDGAPIVEWPLGSPVDVDATVPYFIAFHAWISYTDEFDVIRWNRAISSGTIIPTGWDYEVTTSVSATDDPCYWDVTATVRSSQNVLLYSDGSGGVLDFPISNNTLFPGFGNTQTGAFLGNVESILQTFPDVSFTKRVHRWDGPPPTITFLPGDCNNPTDYRLVTAYDMELVYGTSPISGTQVADITYTGTTELKNTRDIALTIKADDLSDLPHP